jgi:hypothetical protein
MITTCYVSTSDIYNILPDEVRPRVFQLPVRISKSIRKDMLIELHKYIPPNAYYHKDVLSELIVDEPMSGRANIRFKTWGLTLFAVKIDIIDKTYVLLSNMLYANTLKFLRRDTGIKKCVLSLNGMLLDESKELKDLLTRNVVNIFTTQNPNSETINKNSSKFATIYLIQTREFLSQECTIYKIGKTRDELSKRLGNYGKGGKVICTLPCNNDILDEKEQQLIQLFTINFKPCPEIGSEYFEGDCIKMTKLICNTLGMN